MNYPNISRRWENKNIYKSQVTKSMIFFLFLIIVGFQNNIIRVTTDCLYDFGITIFLPISQYLYTNASVRNTIIIISSLLIDLLSIAIVVLWIGWGKSWRFLISTTSFYLFRAMMQFLYNMPYPEYYCFNYPGFPSLMVSYLKTNDFFFSGHVGIPLLLGFEFINQGKPGMMLVCIFTSLYEAFVLVATNGHYGTDIIFGWLFALYFTKIFCLFIDDVDNSCISINEYKERVISEDQMILGRKVIII